MFYPVSIKFLVISLLISFSAALFAAPSAELIPFWNHSQEDNQNSIDHRLWNEILQRNVDANHPSGIHRFNYRAIAAADKQQLSAYLHKMVSVDPRQYSKAEQKSYWINLYNALTVELILKNYPVRSITKISDRFFSFGPWDDPITTVIGKKLTLNEIEHGILRPIWRDNRIHYAVNCASLGCPNLLPIAFTVENTEQLLESAAKAYINHPRGVRFDKDVLLVSNIYQWYRTDFGDSDAALLTHLQHYASEPLRSALQGYRGAIKYHYDWHLNES